MIRLSPLALALQMVKEELHQLQQQEIDEFTFHRVEEMDIYLEKQFQELERIERHLDGEEDDYEFPGRR